MVSLYISNDNILEEYIKTGKINAFSMEGYFAKSVNPVDVVTITQNDTPPLTVNNSVYDDAEKLLKKIISALNQA